jgi:hypothetical protein
LTEEKEETMRQRSLWILILALLLVGAARLPAQDGSNRIVVPLSEPGEPARLSASLVQGTIVVEAYDGAEVIVETRHRSDDDEDCEDCDHDSDSEDDSDDSDDEGRRSTAGLRRIPNMNVGLTAEERNNRVEISSESWNRRVDLVIQVPRRTSLELSTVNGGELRVTGVEGDHELQNTNGGISAIDVRGSVVASTTNGDVEVKLLDITPDKAMSFTTWNGDVDVTFPESLAGTLHLNPGRGEILTDFDLQLLPVEPQVKTSNKRGGYRVEVKQEVKATVGSGGPEMHFRTWNGSVYVRKLQ